MARNYNFITLAIDGAGDCNSRNESKMPHTMKLRPRTPARKSGAGQYTAKCRQRAAVSTAKWGRRFIITTGLVLMILLLRATYYYITADSITSSVNEGEGSYSTGRKLQSMNDDHTNHTNHTSHTSHKGVAWEQCDFEKANSRYVFLIPYAFLIFSLFIGVAIICDDFFVPSLEAISDKLDLSEDVAGATFMAAGSSAPELFTSVAGVGVDSDVGIGTIVGSAMFNILIIIALSAVLSGQVLSLDWRPLARDSLVYGLSIVIFIAFAWDGKLEWYEALILLLIYVMYIAIMKFNPRLLQLLARIECNWCRNESRIEPEISSVSAQSGSATIATQGEEHPTDSHRTISHTHTHDGHDRHRFVHSHRGELAGPITNRRKSVGTHDLLHHHSQASQTNEPPSHQLPTILSPIQSQPSESQEQAVAVPSQGSHLSSATQEEDEEDEVMVLLPCLPPIKTSVPNLTEALQQGKMGIAKYICHWILFVMAFPYLVAYTWTIPNCTNNRKWYVVTTAFLMAILWIAVISFGMVTLVARVGCILDIGEFTMGLVVVAVGTSIPDAISSILVARDGFGDMAVSNAIGSNVFDVNLGLGLPFLIRSIIDRGEAFSLLDDELQDKYDNGDMPIVPHAKFGFLLMFVLLATVGTLTAFRFRLNSFTGLCFVIIYALFLAYSFVQETICKRGQYC